MRKHLASVLLLASAGLMGCGTDESFGSVFSPTNQLNSVTPTAPVVKEFILTPNLNSASVAIRSLNLSTGLTQLVSNLAVGTQPTMVRVHPFRNTFYVTNLASGNVSGFSITPDGATTPLPGSPYTSAGARNIHIHPSGNFLYVGSATELRTFFINGDGSLSFVGSSNMPVGARNEGSFSADGRFLYIPVNDGVQSFTVEKAAGGLATALTHTTIAGAAPANDLAISPDGSLMLVNCQVAGPNDLIAPFTIGANGSLTAQAVQNLTYDVGLGEFARNGVYYVGDLTDANSRLFAYTVSNLGVLTQITGSPFNAPGGGSQTGVDKTDTFVVSAAQGNSMSVSKRNADNTLQLTHGPITGSISGPFVFDFYKITLTN